ncbi:MAG TPA: hypothetical protein DGR97_10730 [Gammaproteobacteria bacterium]|nr:hypothetical protein [Gammaproteobacteria bacterium]|tara:strand:+ start:995 stop:1741 length:747 start_codon:yes stop_codon:yes gene_type:complete
MQKPYVSICGVRTRNQAQSLRKLFVQLQYTTHIGALGFVTSTDSLTGQRFPQFLTLSELFPLLQKASIDNIIHHCSSEPSNIAEEVAQILSYGGIYEKGLCRTIQLNNGLIAIQTLKKIKERFENLRIVLSIDKEAMSNPNLLSEIKNRQRYLTYFLIDPSYGTGTAFDIKKCVDIFQPLVENFPHIVGGFAGGLTANTVKNVVQEIQRNNIRSFSLCVDSGVRGANGCDINKAETYLHNVGTVLNVA